MNSKIDQLENQPDLKHELTEFFKNIRKSKGKVRENSLDQNKNKLIDTDSIESNKMPREKVKIEIDLLQRTTVFSDGTYMWN